MFLFEAKYNEPEKNKFVFFASKQDGNCYIDIFEKADGEYEVVIDFDDIESKFSPWVLTKVANTSYKILSKWVDKHKPKKMFTTTPDEYVRPYLSFLKPFCIPLVPKQYSFDIIEKPGIMEFSIIHK